MSGAVATPHPIPPVDPERPSCSEAVLPNGAGRALRVARHGFASGSTRRPADRSWSPCVLGQQAVPVRDPDGGRLEQIPTAQLVRAVLAQQLTGRPINGYPLEPVLAELG